MSTITTDPIADMLARIRNALAVNKTEIVLPHSKTKESVAKLLKDNNFLNKVAVTDEGDQKVLKISINDKSANANITEINRLSKPGRRYYVGASGIPIVKRGRGIIIISTSHGLMTGNEAKLKGVGGELVCEVY